MSATISLGINTCFAVKRWPEPARLMSVVAEELGLRSCQVSLDQFEPGLDPHSATLMARELSAAADRAGVALHSSFTGLAGYSANLLLHPQPEPRRAALAWFDRAIDLSAELGVAATGGFLGAFSVQDADDPVRRNARVDGLRDDMHVLSEHAQRAGLSYLLFENMAVPRELGHTIPEAHALEALGAGGPVPWVLCLDLGHPCALVTGTDSDDPLAWLAEPWARTPVLQVQQANRQGDFHWPFTPERNAVGLLSPVAVVDALHHMTPGEPVHAFLEIIHQAEHPDDGVLADLRQSISCWNEALHAAGSPRGVARDPG